jgi:hypothetical protein
MVREVEIKPLRNGEHEETKREHSFLMGENAT